MTSALTYAQRVIIIYLLLFIVQVACTTEANNVLKDICVCHSYE